jgi:hypothetical protein
MKLSIIFLATFSCLALAVADPNPADRAVQLPQNTRSDPIEAGKLQKGKKEKADKIVANEAAVDPLAQNIPEKYNRHKEFIPIINNHQGECNCAPAFCPPNRMHAENVQLPRPNKVDLC